MAARIAIQHDYVRQPNGEEQSFSARWTQRAISRGFEVEKVDVWKPELFDRLRRCDAFMWRFGYASPDLPFAKRLLPAVEHGMRIPVYPDWKTSWHFEDKVSESYLLEAAGIPTPETHTFWSESDALQYAETAHYPFVLKLAAGIRSHNVALVEDSAEARRLARRLFGQGARNLLGERERPADALRKNRLLRKLFGKRPAREEPRQAGYFYAQEFLPANTFDTRVTIIGDRAFGFVRYNRDGDFRASGSGKVSWDPDDIDPESIALAFRVARVLDAQTIAIDFLRRGETRLVVEVSYTYPAWGLRDCPGHWRMEADETIRFVPGAIFTEDLIFDVFIDKVIASRADAGEYPPLEYPTPQLSC